MYRRRSDGDAPYTTIILPWLCAVPDRAAVLAGDAWQGTGGCRMTRPWPVNARWPCAS